jgi:ethanolamine ammonia-lyase large subunit
MGLSEEAKEKYRDVVDQLEELLTTLYKMPTDPMVNAHLEMAAEMVERQLGLDIVFPLHEEM